MLNSIYFCIELFINSYVSIFFTMPKLRNKPETVRPYTVNLGRELQRFEKVSRLDFLIWLRSLLDKELIYLENEYACENATIPKDQDDLIGYYIEDEYVKDD